MAKPEMPVSDLNRLNSDALLASMKEGVVRIEAIEDTIAAVHGLHTNTELPGRLRRAIGSERHQRALDKKGDELTAREIERWASSPISETWLERRVSVRRPESAPLQPDGSKLYIGYPSTVFEYPFSFPAKAEDKNSLYEGVAIEGNIADISIADYGTIALADGHYTKAEDGSCEDFAYAVIAGVFQRHMIGVAVLRMGDLYAGLQINALDIASGQTE
jgi:hypothetical protein